MKAVKENPMPNLSPKATVLINKHTPGEIAERVVFLEEFISSNEIILASANTDVVRMTKYCDELQAENAAQAQTIKAAHIRTAEISTRYNDCQREVEELQEDIKRLSELVDEADGWSGNLGA
jgi:hypothetical protein